MANLREIFDAKIAAIRRDIERLEDTANDQTGVEHLRELSGEKFASVDIRFAAIQQQFDERDARTEQAARGNRELVEAALASQKEAVSKNEAYTREQLTSMREQHDTTVQSIRQQIDDLKERLGAATVTLGTGEGERSGTRQSQADTRAWVALGVGVVMMVIAIITVVISANLVTGQAP